MIESRKRCEKKGMTEDQILLHQIDNFKATKLEHRNACYSVLSGDTKLQNKMYMEDRRRINIDQAEWDRLRIIAKPERIRDISTGEETIISIETLGTGQDLQRHADIRKPSFKGAQREIKECEEWAKDPTHKKHIENIRRMLRKLAK